MSAAVDALAEIGTPEAFAAIMDVLGDGAARAQFRMRTVGYALATVDHDAARRVLREAFDSSTDLHSLVRGVLGAIGANEVITYTSIDFRRPIDLEELEESYITSGELRTTLLRLAEYLPIQLAFSRENIPDA